MKFVAFTRVLGGNEVFVAASAVTLVDPTPVGVGSVLTVGGEKVAVTDDRATAITKLEAAL